MAKTKTTMDKVVKIKAKPKSDDIKIAEAKGKLLFRTLEQNLKRKKPVRAFSSI